MPPALSDDESDVEFTTPPRVSRNKSVSAGAASDRAENDVKPEESLDEEGDEGDEDLDEDEFVVEAIKKHIIDDNGDLLFQVKWEGYEAKKDLTWEPEDNLKETAQEILDRYFDQFGGREKLFEQTETAAKTKKRRRAANGTPSTTSKRSRTNAAHPSASAPPATAKKWSPPAGSWEDEIETIDACEDEGSGKLIVYLIWKNNQKTKHDVDIIYKKCPQKDSKLEQSTGISCRLQGVAPLLISSHSNSTRLDSIQLNSIPSLIATETTSDTTHSTANMKKNDVIAIIIIILFIILAAVSFGIWKLVAMAKNHMSASSGISSSSSSVEN
ncbi:hypothetical protein F66182_10308 [Fusarium sp. NRRL 66182]|nr:hypothetical protein F66182_10308 [Fusarium sp. NRRL 66182]